MTESLLGKDWCQGSNLQRGLSVVDEIFDSLARHAGRKRGRSFGKVPTLSLTGPVRLERPC
jgi:hypothetical protein